MHDDPTNPDAHPEGHLPDELAGTAAPDTSALEAVIASMRTELDEAKARALRLMADFQNYQRRSYQNEIVARQQGVSAVATSIVPVIDHFDIALGQDVANASAGQILEGLRAIREEIVKALSRHGVYLLNPEPNTEFLPGLHEAVLQIPDAGIEPGRIVRTFQAGYVLREGDVERVLRAAKVAVAPNS
jgi:molecular chaperone GrpE